MKKRKYFYLHLGIGMLCAFLLWTFAVCKADVQAIGPNGSRVGFATANGVFHEITGVHMSLYIVTDWLGLVPLCVMLGFAILGLVQWVRRKNILKVDRDILLLGGLYLAVMASYVSLICFSWRKSFGTNRKISDRISDSAGTILPSMYIHFSPVKVSEMVTNQINEFSSIMPAAVPYSMDSSVSGLPPGR